MNTHEGRVAHKHSHSALVRCGALNKPPRWLDVLAKALHSSVVVRERVLLTIILPPPPTPTPLQWLDALAKALHSSVVVRERVLLTIILSSMDAVMPCSKAASSALPIPWQGTAQGSSEMAAGGSSAASGGERAGVPGVLQPGVLQPGGRLLDPAAVVVTPRTMPTSMAWPSGEAGRASLTNTTPGKGGRASLTNTGHILTY